MISKQFNIAKQVRDCLTRNCMEGISYGWIANSSLEPAIRRLVYKVYRIGCKDGRQMIMMAARTSLNASGVDGKEVRRPASEVQK
jgi:hypothetical protein